MARIAGVGAYAPRLRIDAEAFADAWGRFRARGVDRKAVPDADEDALTMAAAAGRRALTAAGTDPGAIAHLAFGTTTPPVAEEDLTARLRSMLGAPAAASTATLTGSTRAGVGAIERALAADADGPAVAVAADAPRGAPDSDVEHAAGAGAAAVVLAADGSAAVLERATRTEPYPGTRVRPAGETETGGLGITAYDRAAFREPIAGAVEALDVDPDTVDAVAIQAPDGDLPYRAAGAVGIDREAVVTTVGDLGDTGAASAPLGLARALADGADRVLVIGYGSGAGATAVLVERTDPVPTSLALEGAVELEYPAYLRRRGAITDGPPEGGGAYVSVPSWRRTIPQRHRLVAGRCPDCGALAFPPSGACRDCGGLVEYDRVALPGSGTVAAVTTIQRGGAPPEFAEQQSKRGAFASAIVSFDGPDGGSVDVPVQVVLLGEESVGIGDRVTTTVRRIYEQEDVIRYGLKARPAAADAEAE